MHAAGRATPRRRRPGRCRRRVLCRVHRRPPRRRGRSPTRSTLGNACGAAAAAALGDQTGLPDRARARRRILAAADRRAGPTTPSDDPAVRSSPTSSATPSSRQSPRRPRARTEIRVVRAPGRVNLIGEHTDYNEGFVLPAAIDLEIRIAYLPTADRRVELVRLDGGERDGFDLDVPRPKAGVWLDYVAGTAWALDEAGLPLTGLRGVIASTLPPNAGLSSSAAIELASAWAMLDDAALGPRSVRPRPDLPARRERLRRGPERADGPVRRVVRGRRVGRCCSTADRTTGAPSHCPPDVELVVCHTGSPRHLDGSAYNVRRSQCEAAVAAFAATTRPIRSLRDVTPGAPGDRP